MQVAWYSFDYVRECFSIWVSSTKHWCHNIEGERIVSIIAKIFRGNNSLLITYVQICHLLCIEKFHNIVTQLAKGFHLMSFLNWEKSTWVTWCNEMKWGKGRQIFIFFSFILEALQRYCPVFSTLIFFKWLKFKCSDSLEYKTIP